jgi:queuine tRNA-ribosyltransferase
MLMTEHNLWFYQRLMKDLRDAIATRRLNAYADDFRARYQARGK